MPFGDGTGRLGRGKNCDEKAVADRMGGRRLGQGQRPRDGRGQGLGLGQGRGRGRRFTRRD